MSDVRTGGSASEDDADRPWYLRGGAPSTAPAVPVPPAAPASSALVPPVHAHRPVQVGATAEPPRSSPPTSVDASGDWETIRMPPPVMPAAAADPRPAASAPPLHAAPAGIRATPEPSSSGAGRRVLLGLTAAVVVLAAGAGAGWLIWGQDPDQPTTPVADAGAADDASGAGARSDDDAGQPAPGPDADAGEATPDTPPTATAQTPVVSPEEAALDELDALRDRSLQGLVLDQRWVAQVASKSVGITDPLQTAQNGSHTFYAADILAESNAARASVGNPSAVLVLHSTDFGKRSTASDGQPYWVTLFDGGFGSSDAVKSWCAATYPYLDPAALENACAPRTLSPPHS